MTADDAAAAKAARKALRGFLTPFLYLAVCMLFTVGYVAWSQSENNHKFCATVTAVIAAPAPPGNPRSNPSRAYLQQQHAAFVGLKGRLGC